MQTKNIKILGVVFLGGLFLVSIFFALTKNVNNSPQNSVSLTTASGPVPIKDFTKNPVEKSGQNMAIKETGNFSIVYYAQDQSFTITLLSKPLAQARDLAEQEFLKSLNISLGDACKLNVSLSVPFDVDQNLSGQNWGLSFCPGSKSF